jgi:hypothetical protein
LALCLGIIRCAYSMASGYKTDVTRANHAPAELGMRLICCKNGLIDQTYV